MEIRHTPVLLQETLDWLAPNKEVIANSESPLLPLLIDATMGEGGHSFAFLQRFPNLRVAGIDADAAILEVAKERLAPFAGRVFFYNMWAQDFFANYPLNLGAPYAILADLGVSVFHYEKSGRGFSFSGLPHLTAMAEEKLDMRVNLESKETAASLLARLSEKELADVLFKNADEKYSRSIARRIVEQRKISAITSAAHLAEIVRSARPGSRVHPATKTFMALRIEVNGELSRLPALLQNACDVLPQNGRLGVISFHSGEDRIVKNFFKEKSRRQEKNEAFFETLAGKGLTAGDKEILDNPPSRSARLRVLKRI